MPIIEEIINSNRIKKYGDKCKNLDVSTLFLMGREAEDGISVRTLVKKCNSKQEFESKIRSCLLKTNREDFYHYSLIMGFYFGIFNLYCYQTINKEIRDEIIKSNINCNDTKQFLCDNYSKIYKYFFDTFGLSEEDFEKLIVRVFSLNEDYLYYNNPLIFELGRILIGNTLAKNRGYGNGFIECRDAIDYFFMRNKSVNNDKFRIIK